MFELQVYYHNVLRYTILANWDKVQELRNLGFHVKVKEPAVQESGEWHAPASPPAHEDHDTIAHPDDEFGLHELAEAQQYAEHYAFGFY